MKRTVRILFMPALFALLLFLTVIGASSFAQAPALKPNEMSIWQARRSVIEGLMATNHYFTGLRIRSYKFTLDHLDIDISDHEHFNIDLTTLPPVFYTEGFGVRCFLKAEGRMKLPEPLNKWAVDCANGPEVNALRAIAESYADAVNRLRESARNADDPLRSFPQRAAAWRALAAKPPIPEDIRVQRLMAEDAIKENKPGEALTYYENGIELYPTWPEGNFNAALIAAELKYYSDAIEHMQAYLELVPDAADAQAARDKILIWQVKAKQK